MSVADDPAQARVAAGVEAGRRVHGAGDGVDAGEEHVTGVEVLAVALAGEVEGVRVDDHVRDVDDRGILVATQPHGLAVRGQLEHERLGGVAVAGEAVDDEGGGAGAGDEDAAVGVHSDRRGVDVVLVHVVRLAERSPPPRGPRAVDPGDERVRDAHRRRAEAEAGFAAMMASGHEDVPARVDGEVAGDRPLARAAQEAGAHAARARQGLAAEQGLAGRRVGGRRIGGRRGGGRRGGGGRIDGERIGGRRRARGAGRRGRRRGRVGGHRRGRVTARVGGRPRLTGEDEAGERERTEPDHADAEPGVCHGPRRRTRGGARRTPQHGLRGEPTRGAEGASARTACRTKRCDPACAARAEAHGAGMAAGRTWHADCSGRGP